MAADRYAGGLRGGDYVRQVELALRVVVPEPGQQPLQRGRRRGKDSRIDLGDTALGFRGVGFLHDGGNAPVIVAEHPAQASRVCGVRRDNRDAIALPRSHARIAPMSRAFANGTSPYSTNTVAPSATCGIACAVAWPVPSCSVCSIQFRSEPSPHRALMSPPSDADNDVYARRF